MAHPTVCVLIPAFNSATTIQETLESLQLQGKALERVEGVYLSDDCSTDNTISLATKSWHATVPFYVFKTEQNGGERKNVNRAMEVLAEIVDWVLILHSDDIVKSNWLTTMFTRIDNTSEKVGTVCSTWDTLMADGIIVPAKDEVDPFIVEVEGNLDTVRKTLREGCWWHLSGCAIRCRTFKDVGNFDPQLPQVGDWEWLLRCLMRGWVVEYLRRSLFLYRQHEGSVSTASFRQDRDILESLQLIGRYVHFLCARELIGFHLKRAYFTSRRFVRATTRGDVRRCALVGRTFGRVWCNLLMCLGARLHYLWGSAANGKTAGKVVGS